MRRGLGKLSKIESIMSEYAVVVQNDESKWDDVRGDLYHYPSRYRGILTPGCKIIYYKGKMRNKSFLPYRLNPEAHYFGVGIIVELPACELFFLIPHIDHSLSV